MVTQLTPIKWDGHTHTEMCRHGSGDKTALMIERAIDLGFQRYSITEHAPLPPGVFKDENIEKEFVLLASELPQYLSLVKSLKKEYQRYIDIRLGLEFDYFPVHLEYTRNRLKELENDLDEAIVSLHFIQSGDDYFCIDYSPDNFESGLVAAFKSVDAVHQVYWQLMRQMVTTHFHPSLPIRIGHIGLINKFIKVKPLENPDHFNKLFFKEIVHQIKANQYSLDFDVAGIALETCGKPFISNVILEWCQELKIPLVYGSDTHGIKKVGHFFDFFTSAISKF